MSQHDDWLALRKRYQAFNATELGKLFRAYDKAMIDYWRRDGDDRVRPTQLRAMQEICREKTNAFVAKLMELAGV